MTKQEQLNRDKNAIEGLGNLYNHVNRQIVAIRYLTDDLNFEVKIPDQQERYLMMNELEAHEQVRSCIMNRIRFYRNRIEANKPEPWEEDNAIRTVETPCGPVRVVNTDKASKEELDGMIHHCGQDADMDDACCQARGHQPEGYTYKDLLGMEVIGIGGKSMKCEGCPTDCGNCVKVELVGGDYLCLAEPEQDKPNVINFDEEESNVMVDIKDKTEAFMVYLESVVKSRTHGLG